MEPTPDERLVLISTDGHCGADLWGYKPYLETRYHELFDEWAATFSDAWAEDIDLTRPADNRAGVASINAPLSWDSAARLEYLDAQHIAAEVLFPNTAPPFYPSGALTAAGPVNAEEHELRSAGLRAHNRWLADFCADAPDRRAGFAQVFLDDIEASVDEVRWAASAGLRGVHIPNDHMQKMASLYYPRLDPLWAVCAELDMPVHRHASFVTESVREGGPASALIGMVEIEYYPIRAIGHMILSGVFERHPDLKYVTTELGRACEVPPFLARLDGMLTHGLNEGSPLYETVVDAITALHRTPSEYFASNCYLAGPTNDLRTAWASSVPNVMWGADIPHSEGTAPYTVEALRATLWDVPTEDLRVLLSTRAADLYGFDLEALGTIAGRIGPSVEEVHTPLAPEDRPLYPEQSRSAIFNDRRAGVATS